MIYFDNAATSFPKAPGVAEAMSRFLDEDAANPGRAGHRMAVRAEEMLDAVRLKLTRLLEGEDHNRMIFAMNGTDALNMAIKGVLGHSETKEHVITTVLEHNSVSRPLQAMADSGLIDLTRIPFDENGVVPPQAIREAIRPHTRMIALTHASNVLGTIQDAAAVGQIARENNVLFLLDAAQTVGVLPVSIKQMKIDLLAFPGHKSLLGPTGIGALYVGSRCPEPAEAVADRKLFPWREGGTGGDSSTPTQPALFPYYLEGGTPNTVGVAGLSAGIDYVLQNDMGKILAHEQAMVQQIIDRFGSDDRFTLYGIPDASKRVGTLSLNIQEYDAPDVGSILDDSFEIAVRPGLHCAPYAHQQLETFPVGSVRISPGPFNTQEDIETLLDALDQIAG